MYYPSFEEIKRMDSFVEEMQYYFKDSFSSYDLTLVRNVVYIESISTFEETTGLAIFQDWNGYYYSINFGHCVMSALGDYNPTQINEELAIEEIMEMDDLLKETS